MYTVSTILSTFTGETPLIGWRQNLNPAGEQLTALITSTSGLWYNDQHPLLTFDNLKAVAPRFEDMYSTWISTTEYDEGNIVYYAANQLFYISLQDTNEDQDPLTQTAYWELYSPLTGWLQEKTDHSVISAINAWLDKKFKVKTARNLLERKELFSVTGLISDTITNTGKVCGLSLIPMRSRGVKMTIESIGIQFSENQSVTVKLFDATKAAVVSTQVIAYTGGGGIQWTTVNWTIDGRGAYYIAYNQNAISGTAINGISDHTPYRGGSTHIPFGKYFNVSAFEVEGSFTALWDIEDNVYSHDSNYGLNLRLNVQCDYTEFITEQKNLFKTLIAKQTAMDFLNLLATNADAKVDRNVVNVDKSQVLFEIEGDPRGRAGGLRKQFDDALDSITFDTYGIDKICLPCRKASIEYGAI